MGRPKKDEHSVATPERILHAAIKEFGRIGYEAARLEDIARTAGIQRPAVLYHYASKQKLYEAVCQQIFEELAQVVLAGFATGRGIEDRIAAILARLDAHFLKKPALPRLFLREVIQPSTLTERTARDMAGPLLDMLEDTLRREAGERLRTDVPIRSALLQIFSHSLVFHASGAIGRELWRQNDAEILAKRLLLDDSPAKAAPPARRRSASKRNRTDG